MHSHFYLSDLILELKGQEMYNEMPSTQETCAEPGDDCNSEEGKCKEHLPDMKAPASSRARSGEPTMKDLGKLKKAKALSRSRSKKVKVMATILSQSTLWHDLPIVRETGILG